MTKSIALAALLALSLGACTARQERATGGALLGAAAGGLLGGALSGRGDAAVAGAVIGAAGGAIVADATRPKSRCAKVRYDAYGNAVCTRWVPNN